MPLGSLQVGVFRRTLSNVTLIRRLRYLATGTLMTASGDVLFALINTPATYRAFDFPSTVLIVLLRTMILLTYHIAVVITV